MYEHLPDAARFGEIMGNDRFARLAGCHVLKAEPGYAEVRMPVADAVLNGHDNVQGGALFTLADYAGAIAANLHDAPTMAVNCSISFLNPVRKGHVTARARTVKNGRRMKFQVVELYDAEERLVAVFQGGSMHVP